MYVLCIHLYVRATLQLSNVGQRTTSQAVRSVWALMAVHSQLMSANTCKPDSGAQYRDRWAGSHGSYRQAATNTAIEAREFRGEGEGSVVTAMSH